MPMVIAWFEVDRSKQRKNLFLFSFLDILAQGLVDGVFLSFQAAFLKCLGEERVVNRKIRSHSLHLLLHKR